MNYKKYILLFMFTLLLLLGVRYTILYKNDISKQISLTTFTNNTVAITVDKNLQEVATLEKRGTPIYDYIIGTDELPHYRVFFWVPKNAVNLLPYADKGINTDVSHHGPVEKWSVVVTDKIRKNEELVFIYVPKTFVFLYGEGFEKVIHIRCIN